MANFDDNPFAGDSENPFADPSVASVTNNAARGLEDFNPFEDQNKSQASGSKPKATTAAAPPPAPKQPPPSTSQPAVLQTKEEPPPYVIEEEQENLRRRQEDLERKAAELQRKEQELQRMQFGGYRENNFPPLPKKCPCKPCFFHDISIDIPIDYQKTCKALFYRWQVYSFTMFFNFLSAFALLVDNDEPIHEGETFGLSLLYLVANVPLSFLGWYRPCYNALKNDSSFSYVIFFLIYFLHIGINIFYCLGIPGGGACGFINATEAVHNSVPVGAMMFVSGGLFLAGVIVDCFLLVRVHWIYRLAGASFQKAQGEFARGVASNPHVQSAATEAAAAGVRSAMTGDNRK
ncbi:secretory carrier-associated membrane protein 2-like isoform X2 [Orbicella faveolata]|uniref:secretory carrier-associated membrane protein 2-like isoform X2 n=1 Tax=Orbicella faveolata TaxID=48498 RepID=UPI0009E53753|nr:secretory carrier-associated membrane protein 2-like isoform X2 [Orbicella faveolata]